MYDDNSEQNSETALIPWSAELFSQKLRSRHGKISKLKGQAIG